MAGTEDQADEHGAIIAFRAPADLIAAAEAAARCEGITRSDVARRALMKDLKAAGIFPAPRAGGAA